MLAAAAPWSAAALAQDAAPGAGFDFDLPAAEHLLNRAGFGAGPDELQRFQARGLDAAVESLFLPHKYVDPFPAVQWHIYDLDEYADARAEKLGVAGLSADERRERLQDFRRERRRKDYRQMGDYAGWWIERMLDGDDPLRDRMTLFWHGYFTSSMQDVRNSWEMIQQHALLREHALGNFGDLLLAIAQDPAMLEYLDNDVNKKREPNENFARELLELFTLGEGFYEEADIVAAAAAFTGWTDRRGEYVFKRAQHDSSEKTFLGVTGKHGGEEIIAILLEQPRTAAYLATRLLGYFEGRATDTERVGRYADLLLEGDYELRPFLEALFRDPEFYADDVRGLRIASPIDFLVGTSRRIGCDPPPEIVGLAAQSLGESLFFPPNVKGWPGGRAWITTSTLMQRGNLAGVFLGALSVSEFLEDVEEANGYSMDDGMDDGMDEGMAGGMAGGMADGMDGDLEAAGIEGPDQGGGIFERALKAMDRLGWSPRIHLGARIKHHEAHTDAEVVDCLCRELLAIEVQPAPRAELVAWLESARDSASLPEGGFMERGYVEDGEAILRRLAHLILSLPEAQLH
jgi:hypothetical protein